ncbi:MAG: 16S rRNA (uracil(1498)-N(3))-methyltransferase [Bacteroidales bacterium]|nr:16S rRNA (uracil(1498)-N(3))-methyltransferase [Bacteroidales bacterium]
MELFFTTDIQGSSATLDEQESTHCLKVLRHKRGDKITFTDGAGGLYEAEISDVKGKLCKLNIISQSLKREERPYYLHIAVAPTKSLDRYEWFLEKAVEFGADRITPIIGDHSERKIFKHERGERVILSALKQSLKTNMPLLDETINLREFLKSDSVANFNGVKLIGHCNTGERSELTTIVDSIEPVEGKKRVLILIGPEGDFSPEEVKMAIEKGFSDFTMGESRFRVETAAVAAISAMYFLSRRS